MVQLATRQNPMNRSRVIVRFILLLLVSAIRLHATSLEECVNKIAPLADPENRTDPAPPRLQKIVYWLAVARQERLDVTNILDIALRRVMTNQWAGRREIVEVPVWPHRLVPGRTGQLVQHTVTNEAPIRQFTLECLLRALHAAEDKGCLNAAGLERMRRGEPAIPPRESQEGNPLIAEEFVSVALCPRLAGFMANFHLIVRRQKEAHIIRFNARGRKVLYADKFLELGVISRDCHDKFIAELPEVTRQ